MNDAANYHLRTVLVGFFGVPLGLSLSAGVLLVVETSFLPDSGLPVSTIVSVVTVLLALAGLFALWYRLGRVRVRPASSWVALLSVAIVPGYFLAAWIVCFALSGNVPAFAIANVQGPAFPWIALTAAATLIDSPVLMFGVLSAVLRASGGGFALGHRRRASVPRSPRRRSSRKPRPLESS